MVMHIVHPRTYLRDFALRYGSKIANEDCKPKLSIVTVLGFYFHSLQADQLSLQNSERLHGLARMLQSQEVKELKDAIKAMAFKYAAELQTLRDAEAAKDTEIASKVGLS